MTSLKQLHGIAHNLAHHAQSSLSWLHPHLARACREAGVSAATVELLAREPYPATLPDVEPLRLALGALRQWFLDLLDRQGFTATDVRSASLTFECDREDDYNAAVRALLITRQGKEYSGRVNYI